MKTLFERLYDHAIHTPNLEAIITDNTVVSYKILNDTVNQLCQKLLALNTQKLAIWDVNSIDWIYIDLAAKKARITVIPIPLFFSTEQILHLVKDSAVDTLFIGAAYLNLNHIEWLNLLYAQKAIQNNHKIQYVSGQLIQLEVNSGIKTNDRVSSKITYTSGSTGTPKGVHLGESTLQSITESLSQALTSSQLGRHLSLLPFATLLENIAGVYVALHMGRSVFIGPVQQFGLISNHEFHVDQLAHTLKHNRIESIILLPHMLKAIVEYIQQYGTEAFEHLKFIAVGGGKVADELLLQSAQFHLPVYEGYGLSECASVVSLNLPEAQKIGSVGKPLPHAQVSISDHGEIVVQSHAIEHDINQNISDSLIYTGDAGFFDAEGFLFITGRIKQIIISSFGRNISPEWVEANALTAPEIHQIAIFGEAKPELSAVIYAKPDISDSILEQAIHKVNQRMPDYAHIKQWCRATNPFSSKNRMLTDNGKLRRHEIQRQFQL